MSSQLTRSRTICNAVKIIRKVLHNHKHRLTVCAISNRDKTYFLLLTESLWHLCTHTHAHSHTHTFTYLFTFLFRSLVLFLILSDSYILSLAMADLLVIVTTVPLTSVIYVLHSWPWGEVLCVLSEYFKDVSIGVSVFTLTALSGDRFVAIVDPLRKFHSHSGKRATRITIIIAVSIWILAACLGIPAIRGSYIRVIYIIFSPALFSIFSLMSTN